MMENKNAPEIRFKGFTDAWDKRKLSSFSDETHGGGTPKTSEESYWNGNIPWIQSSDIIEHEVFGVLLKKKITSAGLQNSAAKLVPANSIAIITRVGVGKLVFMPYEYSTSQDFVSLSKLNVDELFGIYSLYIKLQNESNVTQGTSIKGITKDELLKKIISVPAQRIEQKKIGSFFAVLDNILTLQKRKLDSLKKLKKGYLQQMFPQEGDVVPRVRFAGFAGEWEERKLGEIVRRVQGNDGRMDLPTLTISAGSGWLDQRERFSSNIAGKEQENYTLLSKGELSYNKGNSKLATCGIVFELTTHEEALVPRVYHSFKTTQETNAAFLEYRFATKIPDRELSKLITSGARMDGLLNIGFEDFVGIKIHIPTKIEQVVIANFLRIFDEHLATQQTKLDKLKQLKTAYLQKMFI